MGKWIVSEKPNVRFEQIAGLDEVKEAINLRVIYPFRHPEAATRFRKKAGGGVLLYDPPGTGRTMIAKVIATEGESVRRGGLTPTEEAVILRRIERLEKQRADLERHVSIYNENVNLHLNLIAKIQEMEAMRSRGVSEVEIDRLVDEVESSVEEYKRVGIAAESGSSISPAVDSQAERRRLEGIKKRILGTREEREVEPDVAKARPEKPGLE